ncbi:MAG: hypothetical protein Q9187_007627, partial [Circinaria calcarea]
PPIAQWHSWLRHLRADAPSIHEQQSDLQRQAQLKQLARLADERWASKPSFLDAPSQTSQPGPATIPRDKAGYVGQTESDEKEGVRNAVGGLGEVGDIEATRPEKKREKINPWKQQRGNPGESWQPEAWTPGPVKR